jgi:hypothetical protein
MFRTGILLVTLALTCAAQTNASKKPKAPVTKPEAKYSSVAEVQAAAENGVPEAQFMLGVGYQNGSAGLTKDDAEAMKWFQKAAKQGNPTAMNAIGHLYEDGKGAPQNLPEAISWYQRAAEKGDEWAQVRVGRAYTKGEGVGLDKVEAVKWYRKAASQGSLSAQFYLGHALQQGEGAPQNFVEAAKWFRKAAEGGQGDAQFRLAMAYLEGQGVTKNVTEAYVWSSLAAANGHANGPKLRDLAAGMLSPQSLRQAQARALKVSEGIQKRKKS